MVSKAQNHLLERSISFESLQKVLIKDDSWINYPAYNDREAWEKMILPEVRENIIAAGEKALGYEWKPDLATDYLAYKRTGEIRTGRTNHKTLLTLTLAELAEGEGRFLDEIINGVWFMCETSWVHSAHAYFQKDQSGLPDPDEPTVELVVADIGAQMAWTYYFLHEAFDKVSPLIAKRVRKTVFERLIDPYFKRTDYWWMGLQGQKVNNWNVWINYNVLQAVMLLVDDSEKKAEYLYRLMLSVDCYIDQQYRDGACDEGPTYFDHAGANLLKFLDLLYRATEGDVCIFDNEKVQNMGRYIYRVHIDGRYFVNFSDAAAMCRLSPGAVYHYGKCIGDHFLMGFASDFARETGWVNSLHRGTIFARVLDDISMAKEILSGQGNGMEESSFYFEDSELAVARDGFPTDQGFCFAAHGSHNDVSHNHNDAGSCMLYYNGRPILIDVGVGTYTRKTFSAERYTIWTMQSCYHNLPTINGSDQQNGRRFRARNASFMDSGHKVAFSTDITKAYPDTTGIVHWIRSYELKRGQKFVIADDWELESVKGTTILNFMTPYEVSQQAEGCLLLTEGASRLRMEYDATWLKPTVEAISFDDKSLKSSWPSGVLYRIRFIMYDMKPKGMSRITIRPER